VAAAKPVDRAPPLRLHCRAQHGWGGSQSSCQYGVGLGAALPSASRCWNHAGRHLEPPAGAPAATAKPGLKPAWQRQGQGPRLREARQHLGLPGISPASEPESLHPGGQGRAASRCRVAGILQMIERQHEADWLRSAGRNSGQGRLSTHPVGMGRGGGRRPATDSDTGR